MPALPPHMSRRRGGRRFDRDVGRIGWCGLLGRRRPWAELVLLEAIAQGVPAHAKAPRRMRDVPASFVERLVDPRPLGLFHCVLERRRLFGSRSLCVMIPSQRC